MLGPELATGREAAGLFWWFILLKIYFLFLFILMDTILRCPCLPRGTRWGPAKTLRLGVSRFSSHSIHRDAIRAGSTLALFCRQTPLPSLTFGFCGERQKQLCVSSTHGRPAVRLQ